MLPEVALQRDAGSGKIVEVDYVHLLARGVRGIMKRLIQKQLRRKVTPEG